MHASDLIDRNSQPRRPGTCVKQHNVLSGAGLVIANMIGVGVLLLATVSYVLTVLVRRHRAGG